MADVVTDQLMATLGHAAFKVLHYIIRRTIGFDKPQDAISLSQFQHGITTRDGVQLDYGTGLSRESVLAGIAELEQRALIIVVRRRSSAGDADTSIYRPRLPDKVDHPVGKADHVVAKPDHQVVRLAGHGGRVASPGVAGQVDRQESDSQESVSQEESPPDISQNCARETEPPDTPRRDAEPSGRAEPSRSRPSEDLLPTIRHLARRVANGARRAAWHRQLAADLADYVAKSPLSAAQLERLVRLVEAHGPLRTEAEFWERLDLYRATYVQPQAVPACLVGAKPLPISAIVPAEPSAPTVGSPLELAKGRRT